MTDKAAQKGVESQEKARKEVDDELSKAAQYFESGEFQKAEVICKRALEIIPNRPEFLHLLGVIAYHTGDADEAANLIEKAIHNEPENPICYNSLGNLLEDRGKPDEAISCYEKALRINPYFAGAYNNLGNTFREKGKIDQAIGFYQKATGLRPDFAEAYNNLGNSFRDKGRVHEAISCYQKALQLKPDYAKAYDNLGKVFQDPGRFDEAVSCYRKALALEPDLAEACKDLVLVLQRLYAWGELDTLAGKLDGFTKKALDVGTKPAEHPFLGITRYTDVFRNFSIARLWSSHIERRMSALKMGFSFDVAKSCKTKIAIGHLSNDFRDHAVAHIMRNLFRLHSRNEFEIFCYSYGKDDGSQYRKQIEQDCDQFVDLCHLSDPEAAKRIYEDQVDILIDLTGYTEGSRMNICALWPASIQVTYLGFPGTTGARFFDYIITDRIVTPEEHVRYHSEKFVYMPDCYMVNDNTPPISTKTWRHMDFGLSEDSIVFCCFNSAYKIEPAMFEVWMKILAQVPKSVLWLPLIAIVFHTSTRQFPDRLSDTLWRSSTNLVKCKRKQNDCLQHIGLARFLQLPNIFTLSSETLIHVPWMMQHFLQKRGLV